MAKAFRGSQESLSLPRLVTGSALRLSSRHATAMHMLEAGVPAEVIALWLGHESPNTTHGYVEASLAMKKRALESLQSPKAKRQGFRVDDSLIRFLDTL